MNQKQTGWLANYRKLNEFTGEKESEWTPPTCIHSSEIEYIYSKLRELE